MDLLALSLASILGAGTASAASVAVSAPAGAPGAQVGAAAAAGAWVRPALVSGLASPLLSPALSSLPGLPSPGLQSPRLEASLSAPALPAPQAAEAALPQVSPRSAGLPAQASVRALKPALHQPAALPVVDDSSKGPVEAPRLGSEELQRTMEQAAKTAEETRKQGEEKDAAKLLDDLARIFDGFQRQAEEAQARAAAQPYPLYEAKVFALPPVPEAVAAEHAGKILDMIQERLASDPWAYYHRTHLVGELFGLPDLHGPTETFGRAFLRDLQKQLVVQGTKRGLFVNAVFDWRTGPRSYGLELQDETGRRWDFRIENDYGDDRTYWERFGSVGAVYLTIREPWEPPEPGLGERLAQYMPGFQPKDQQAPGPVLKK